MLRKAATVLLAVTTIAVAVYSFFLIVPGQSWTIVDEATQAREIVFVPAPAAVIPLVCALSILVGLYLRKPKLYWLGLTCLSIFSGLFLFGIGGGLIPACLLIFVFLVILKFSKPNT